MKLARITMLLAACAAQLIEDDRIPQLMEHAAQLNGAHTSKPNPAADIGMPILHAAAQVKPAAQIKPAGNGIQAAPADKLMAKPPSASSMASLLGSRMESAAASTSTLSDIKYLEEGPILGKDSTA